MESYAKKFIFVPSFCNLHQYCLTAAHIVVLILRSVNLTIF